MDQLTCASLSYTHYRYEVDISKVVPASLELILFLIFNLLFQEIDRVQWAPILLVVLK